MAKTSLRAQVFGWFSHPVVGFVGTITGIIGIVLSVWMYVQQVPSRAVAVVEPSIRSVLVNRQVPAGIEVHVRGTPVSNQDVFTVQLALWNKGNQSIRPEHILEPFVLKPSPGTRVVDAAVIRETRRVCGSSMTVATNGESAALNWRIYEPDDGVIVQLVLVGDSKATIGVAGTIEGGGRLRYIRRVDSETKQTGSGWNKKTTLLDWAGISAFAGLFGFSGVAALASIPKLWKKWREPKGKGPVIGAALWGVIGTGIGVLLVVAVAQDAMNNESVPSSLLRQNENPPQS